jgi:uncharacterized protein
MQAFLDTSFLLTLESIRDQHRDEAVAHWNESARNYSGFVTTSYVFDEVVSFLNARGGHATAVDVGERLRNSELIDFIHVDEALFSEGWTYFVRHSDKTYSLTDCISFVLMQARGLTRALSFDQHFTQAGFRIEPS